MPISIQTSDEAGVDTRVMVGVPLLFVVAVAVLTLMLYSSFEAALEVLAPAMLGVCAVVLLSAVIQLVVSTRRRRRRARSYPEIARAISALARGDMDADLQGIGDEWHTMDAARAMVAARPQEEQLGILRAMCDAGLWRPVAHRAQTSRSKWHRVHALNDLGWLRARDAAPVIFAALSDEDDDIAWAALVALGGLHDDVAYEVLLEMLEDGRFATSRVAQVLDASTHPDAVRLLRTRLAGSAPGTLFWIAYLLGRSDRPDAFEPLLELTRHDDADVRASATEALGRLGDPRAVDRLMALMHDDRWFVRLHACRSLGDLRAADALEALQVAAHDPNWWVRRSAAEALGALQDVVE